MISAWDLASFYPEQASLPFRGIGKKKCDFSFLKKSITYVIDIGGTAVCRTIAQQNKVISGWALVRPCLCAIALVQCSLNIPVVAPPIETPAPAYAEILPSQKGAIATVNPLATQAAVDAFNLGGNAIDAALAAAFTLGVVDSHNSGIGGGCLILARLASGRIVAIDGREMAPARATRDMYLRDNGSGQAVPTDNSKTGGLAAGIPGSVQALFELQQMGGKLSFAEVITPAAQLAERGFPIDNTLASRLASRAQQLAEFPASAAIFLKADGQPLEAGEILVQKDLAASYRHLAKEGPAWFYHGDFAVQTSQWMSRHGGIIDRQDFANYRTVLREPIHSQFREFDIYGFGPPSSGGVHVAQVLNILADDELSSLTNVERFQLTAEALKLAFADRAQWLGDADYVPVPKGLITADYGRHLRTLINLGEASAKGTHHLPPDANKDFFNQQLEKHTTHLTTADAQGNWVAITTTLNTSFGSKVVVPNTGVLLNNQMDDFATAAGMPNAFGLVGAKANSIAPGKRPLSSMSPTLVLRDGQPILTLGAAGGPTIISQVVQVLINYLALNQTLEKAVAAPRIHHQWQPELLFTELPLDGDIAQALRARGYQLRASGDFGGTQAIAFKDGQFSAVTEPRIIRRNSR
jgi:gamma-glutamyltranspeptidase/glutathione hydrolase